jgi:PTS system mannose-specific IIA component
MLGILIVTHGKLGEALISAATHIVGKPLSHVRALSVDGLDDPDTLLSTARAMAQQLDQGDGVLVLSDICGGTPCNVATRLVAQGRIDAVSGVSLPMLVRALTYRDRPLAEVVAKALIGGTEGVIRLSGEAAHASSRS